MYNRNGKYKGKSSGGTSRPFESKWDSGSKTCPKCSQGWEKGTMMQYENNVIVHVNCPTPEFQEAVKVRREQGSISRLIRQAKTAGVTNEGEDIAIPEIIQNKMFVPSVYQQKAYDWALNGTGHAVLKAVAGSGKTTTIVNLLDLLPRTLRVLFIAFNKVIVKTLKAKVRAKGYDNIDVVTLNSKGFTVCRKYEGFRDMNGDKVYDILTDMGYKIDKASVKDAKKRTENRVFRSAMKKVVELVKATLADFNDPDAILDIITRYNIQIDEQMEQEIIEKLPQVMEINNADLEYIDFNDQNYLPVVHPYFADKFDQYDFVLCDEFQDFNRTNIEFALKCLAPNGRILAVGDHHQSLYGFRGADVNAIPDAIERLHATVLPLSVSYRCPRSHVEYVKRWVPDIEPAPNAIEGKIGDLAYEQMMQNVKEGDFVLCRTNAPLIKPAFRVIREGRKAIIRGKEIGKELVNFIERFQCDDLGRLDILMQQFTEAEIDRWLAKNKEMMAEQAKERYQTIVEVMQECTTVSDLITKLETLFSDDNVGVVFSSIHRAKGLESQCVYWYRQDLCPHSKAKSDDEIQQEFNAMYVAGTRSLDELYFVSAED